MLCWRTFKLLSLFHLVVILPSCTWSDSDSPTSLGSLYRQRIRGSQLVLYEFAYPSSFAFTSDYTGVTVLDSGTVFARSKIARLPSAYFATTPAPDNLRLITIEGQQTPTVAQDTLLTPRRQYDQRFNNVPFHVTEYHDTYGSATMDTGLMEYSFSQVRETADSVIFYHVTKKFGGRDFPATVAFPKGNIRVVDSARHYVNHIEVEQFVRKRGAVYLPPARMKLISNQPIIGWAFYWFYPRQRMRSAALTDWGIWKRVK